MTVEEFEIHVQKTAKCWYWLGDVGSGSTTKTPMIRMRGLPGAVRDGSPRRVAWELYHEGSPLEPWEIVRATCMEALCVNPDHLFVDLRRSGRRLDS